VPEPSPSIGSSATTQIVASACIDYVFAQFVPDSAAGGSRISNPWSRRRRRASLCCRFAFAPTFSLVRIEQERDEPALRLWLPRGTDGSNPVPSSAESCANLIGSFATGTEGARPAPYDYDLYGGVTGEPREPSWASRDCRPAT
jgi:hypothetical protein